MIGRITGGAQIAFDQVNDHFSFFVVTDNLFEDGAQLKQGHTLRFEFADDNQRFRFAA